MRSASVAIAVLCLAVPGALRAQEAQAAPEHHGFWVAFGLGGGSNLADGVYGIGGYVRLGGTISQKFLIGGEISSFLRANFTTPTSHTESGMTAVALFYPAARGLFLKGGAGFAVWLSSTDAGPTTSTTTAGGFAGTLGVGYDLRIGSNLYLTPNVDFMYHTLESESPVFDGVSSGQLLMVTLGLTWH